ncbi:MAG: aspartate aminotransferase family protein [Clostridiaceae bacterium]|jgi:predicted acetylornithine/succinylornithine family transaminase|nr:aspartate aminotransferase family protein [Clostridiaceae bacterium]
MTEFERIKKQDNEYFMNVYAPYDIAFVSGDGCTLTDSEGKKYVDFLGGIAVNALGYNHPVFVNAITEQSKKLSLISNYFYSEQRGLLAKELIKGTKLKKAFFGNSGAEANECAIKLARKYFFVKGQQKFKIITAADSFHGRTLATVTATGQPKYNLAYVPLPAGLGDYVPYNDIKALETALNDPTVAAFMIEVIQGEGGICPATQEYVTAARKITHKNGQLLIIDEIQTGGGRTGKFWAFEHFGVDPDIITAAKAIGGGFPISACLATDEVAAAFVPGDHGTTFGAAPLACGVSLAVVKEIRYGGLLENAEKRGAYLAEKLTSIGDPRIKTVRGKGLLLGAEIDASLPAKQIVLKMFEEGYVLNVCGHNVLRFVPPLIISEKQIDSMTAALKRVLKTL